MVDMTIKLSPNTDPITIMFTTELQKWTNSLSLKLVWKVDVVFITLYHYHSSSINFYFNPLAQSKYKVKSTVIKVQKCTNSLPLKLVWKGDIDLTTPYHYCSSIHYNYVFHFYFNPPTQKKYVIL